MKYKFIHIMSHKSLIFNAQVVHMINDNPNDFEVKEHLFIISNKNVYEQVNCYKNIVYEENISVDKNVFLKYANMCDYIFLHSNTIRRMTAHLNKKILNKIIWCEWGHDLFTNEYYHDFSNTFIKKIKNIIKFFPKKYLNYKMRQYYAIGIGGVKEDVLEAKCEYGRNMKILMTPYGYKYNDKSQKYENIKFLSRKNTIKIMIGHSAYPFLHHKKIIDMLSKYKDEHIIISLVLSYGNMQYAEEVKNYAINIFGKEKVEIINKKVPYLSYCKYIDTVDIAVFDYKHQSALGNVLLLMSKGKKIFLAKDGYIKLICTMNNIESYDIDDIEFMSFDDFSTPIQNIENSVKYSKQFNNNNDYKLPWILTINELEKNIKNKM